MCSSLVLVDVFILHITVNHNSFRFRFSSLFPEQLCQFNAVGGHRSALHAHHTVDIGAGFVGAPCKYAACQNGTDDAAAVAAAAFARVDAVCLIHSRYLHIVVRHGKGSGRLIVLRRVQKVGHHGAVLPLHRPAHKGAVAGLNCRHRHRGADGHDRCAVEGLFACAEICRCNSVFGGDNAAVGRSKIAELLAVGHLLAADHIAFIPADQVQIFLVRRVLVVRCDLTALRRVIHPDLCRTGKAFFDVDLLVFAQTDIVGIILKSHSLQRDLRIACIGDADTGRAVADGPAVQLCVAALARNINGGAVRCFDRAAIQAQSAAVFDGDLRI